MASEFNYSISGDITSGTLNEGQLYSEIASSAIVTALGSVNSSGDNLNIVFKADLSAGDKTILDAVVAAHVADPLFGKDVVLTDPDTGAPVITTKKLPSGYYPELREIEFTSSQLNSIHDKDFSDVDLGMTTLKFFDANRVELVNPTQVTLDESCKFTVLKFAPGVSWGIRMASIRQIDIPALPLYVWVNFKIMLDPTPTYLTLPYANGGLNMQFQNARESIGVGDENYSFFTANDHLEWQFEHQLGEKHKFRIIYESSFKIPGS